MDLELREICTTSFPFELNGPFAVNMQLKRFSVVTKAKTYIMQENFKSHVSEEIDFMKFSTTQVKCADSRPTKNLPIDDFLVFESASDADKNILMLDANLIPSISVPFVQTQQTLLAPIEIHFQQRNVAVAATLNSLGSLEIHHNFITKRSWTKCLEISKIWWHTSANEMKNPDFKCTKMSELLPSVNNLVVTAFCWFDCILNDACHLICALKSGTILIWKLNIEQTAEMQFDHCYKYDSSNANFITNLKFISTIEELLLVAGDTIGHITLYSIELETGGYISSIQMKHLLWDEEDNLAISHFEYRAVNEEGHILLLAVKSLYLILFIIHPNGEILSKLPYYVGHVMITAVQHIKDNDYMIATFGPVFHLKIIIDPVDNTIGAIKNEIKKPNSFSKYYVYGISASENKAYWVFALLPAEAYDHLILRKPTVIVICQYTGINVMEMLLHNPTYRLTNVHDCVEVIRFTGSKNYENLKELEPVVEKKPELSDEYIYHLKLKTIVYSAYSKYFRIKDAVFAKQSTQEYEMTSYFLETIYLYRALHHLTNLPALSGLQLKSMRNIKYFLKHLMGATLLEENVRIQEAIMKPFHDLMEKTADLLEDDCSDVLVERCCRTKIEIEVDDTIRNCPNCLRVAVVEDKFREILGSTIEYLCPVCDIRFMDLSNEPDLGVEEDQ